MSLTEPAIRTDPGHDESPARTDVDREAAPGPGLAKRLIGSTLFITLLVVIAFIGVWWLVAAYVINDPVLLPSPSGVATRFGQLIRTSAYWQDVKASTERAVLGWGVGVAAGVLVGSLMGMFRAVRLVLDPFIEFGRPIPPLAFAPLLIVWFGIGELSKDVVVFLGVFPIVVIATTSAVAGVDQDWKRAALTLGASRPYLLRRVILPAVMPEVITAMRLASGLAWGALVAAEMIASNNGLGFMILQASQFVDTPRIVVGIVTIGCLAFTSDRLLRMLNSRFAIWRGQAH